MNNIKDSFYLLKEKKKIAIIPHKNPDADALGSCLAWYHFLTKKGHIAKVISPNSFPKFLHWMPYAKEIIIAENEVAFSKDFIETADIVYCLDFNTLSRVDELENHIKANHGVKILIDHHLEPDDFDFVYSDTQIPSTCQMIYHLIEMMGEELLIDLDMATCLYAGIIADTGNFRFSSVKPKTHIVAAKLLEIGVSQSMVYNNLFENTSIQKLKLLAEMIHKMEYLEDYNTSIIHLDKQDLLKFNYEKGDTEGFVNYGLMIDGCVLSVALFEDIYKDNTIKISFRSKGNFDVNQFSRKYFEGGGHTNAAGGVSKLSMNETIEKIKNLIKEYKNKLNTALV